MTVDLTGETPPTKESQENVKSAIETVRMSHIESERNVDAENLKKYLVNYDHIKLEDASVLISNPQYRHLFDAQPLS